MIMLILYASIAIAVIGAMAILAWYLIKRSYLIRMLDKDPSILIQQGWLPRRMAEKLADAQKAEREIYELVSKTISVLDNLLDSPVAVFLSAIELSQLTKYRDTMRDELNKFDQRRKTR